MPEAKTLMSLVWMFVCVIAVIVLAYVFTKYIVGRGKLGGMRISRNGTINVITQLTFGRDRQVVLVQVGDKYFLLGVTASNISMLTELNAEDMKTLLETDNNAEGAQPPSFSQALKTVLKDRTKR